GIGGFTEERASLRTWLYKIATNRCLNARRAASRRPAREWDVSQFEPPVPTPRDEPVWLQPFPDALLEGAAGRPAGPEAPYAPAAGSPAEDAIVARFARAWESADLDALVALLTDDVFIAMPPEPFGYEGRDLVARYWARQFAAGRRYGLVPTRANGQPAFGAYL